MKLINYAFIGGITFVMEVLQAIRDLIDFISFRACASAFVVFTPTMYSICPGFTSAARPIVFPKARLIPVCIRSAPAPVSILFSRRM